VNAIRKYLQTKGGRIAGVVATVVALGVMLYVLKDVLGANAATAASRDRVFICSKTGKTFGHSIKLGESLPVESPYTGEKTGYPAEACYWTADGGTKTEPTYVLLNDYAGKSGPTFCPDCGRLVTPLNQAPQPGSKPPPTRDQIKTASKERR
jgi:hypothetical protein